MFDTLVESQKQKKGKTGGLVAGITAIYLLGLLTAGIVTVFLFNPQLTGGNEAATMLAPPPPPPPPPPPAEAPKPVLVKEVPTVFAPPKTPPKDLPDPNQVKSKPVIQTVAVAGVAGSTGVPGGVPGGVSRGDDAPPPPPPPPPPKPDPTPTPTPPPPKKINVSGGVLQGSALRRVQPTYPPIAKAARASGAVQVAVEIDEEGDVTSASVVGGHPLLRQAALDAARKWKFKPTMLSGVPVKVSGVLTFNFTLN